MNSVLQDWVIELPLREQGAYIRWCFMNPADERETDIPGSFFQSVPTRRTNNGRRS